MCPLRVVLCFYCCTHILAHIPCFLYCTTGVRLSRQVSSRLGGRTSSTVPTADLLLAFTEGAGSPGGNNSSGSTAKNNTGSTHFGYTSSNDGDNDNCNSGSPMLLNSNGGPGHDDLLAAVLACSAGSPAGEAGIELGSSFPARRGALSARPSQGGLGAPRGSNTLAHDLQQALRAASAGGGNPAAGPAGMGMGDPILASSSPSDPTAAARLAATAAALLAVSREVHDEGTGSGSDSSDSGYSAEKDEKGEKSEQTNDSTTPSRGSTPSGNGSDSGDGESSDSAAGTSGSGSGSGGEGSGTATRTATTPPPAKEGVTAPADPFEKAATATAPPATGVPADGAHPHHAVSAPAGLSSMATQSTEGPPSSASDLSAAISAPPGSSVGGADSLDSKAGFGSEVGVQQAKEDHQEEEEGRLRGVEEEAEGVSVTATITFPGGSAPAASLTSAAAAAAAAPATITTPTTATASTTEATEVPEGAPSRHLWLGNIPLKPNKAALELLFSQLGPLESVRVFPGVWMRVCVAPGGGGELGCALQDGPLGADSRGTVLSEITLST
jgi:hypothetical protein